MREEGRGRPEKSFPGAGEMPGVPRPERRLQQLDGWGVQSAPLRRLHFLTNYKGISCAL